MPSLVAASGESRIAIPSDGSIAPRTNTSMVIPFVGLVTLTLSPGSYPTVLANNPAGISPLSATTALPSRDGRAAANRSVVVIKSSILQNERFIYPSFPIVSAVFQNQFSVQLFSQMYRFRFHYHFLAVLHR